MSDVTKLKNTGFSEAVALEAIKPTRATFLYEKKSYIIAVLNRYFNLLIINMYDEMKIFCL